MTYGKLFNSASDIIREREQSNTLSEYEKELNRVAGIYAITVHNVYVYIGKTYDLLHRILEHNLMIFHPEVYDIGDIKYKMLGKLYEDDTKYGEPILNVVVKPILRQEEYNEEDLSMLEAVYIRRFLPYFNIAIPKLDGSIDYYKYYSTSIDDLLDYIKEKMNYENV